jgi:hypothetical protein
VRPLRGGLGARGEAEPRRLAAPHGRVRGPALIELARLEVEYRRRAGEALTADEYENRYPELRDDPAALAWLHENVMLPPSAGAKIAV